MLGNAWCKWHMDRITSNCFSKPSYNNSALSQNYPIACTQRPMYRPWLTHIIPTYIHSIFQCISSHCVARSTSAKSEISTQFWSNSARLLQAAFQPAHTIQLCRHINPCKYKNSTSSLFTLLYFQLFTCVQLQLAVMQPL